jgi:hypothetical protein
MKYRSKKSKRVRNLQPIGIVVHRGTSPGTGDPYVVIATFHSENEKTGNVVTVWIVRDDVKPTQAKSRGEVHATCLDCVLGMVGGCYVVVQNAPNAIWRAYKDGRYEEYAPERHDSMIAGRVVRWGGYGEPVLVDLEIIRHWSHDLSIGWSGYTQQWRRPEFQAYRSFFMASVHSIRQADLASTMGWRYFRDCASLEDEPVRRGEFLCPASYEGGERMQCIDCKQGCNGANRPVGEIQRASVVTQRHANAVETLILNKAIREGRVSFDA